MAGIMQRSTIQCIGEGKVLLEDGSGISGVVLSARTGIRIGQRTNLGVNTRVYDHDFHSIEPEHRIDRKTDSINVRAAPVDVGNDVFVGANALILKGAVIGSRSIVAAGSVVLGGNYPAGSLIGGNPGKILSQSIHT